MDLFCCCSKIQDNRRRRRPYGSFSLSSTSSIATLPRLSGVTYEPPFVPPSGKLPVFDEFDLLCLIGKGSFGKVREDTVTSSECFAAPHNLVYSPTLQAGIR